MNATEAAKLYIDRKNRVKHPDGKFDKQGRWYPSDMEHQTCCRAIRTPSAAYPFSYMTHCRTAEHVAHLCSVDVKELKREAKKIDAGQ